MVNDVLTDEFSKCLHLNSLVHSHFHVLYINMLNSCYLHVLLFITVYLYF